ncbi:50S ribosomal protein L6 [Candidatus Peregrinibacteria bacterium CG22_combo_CG10-13_8_21_14_all_44_10]|nr:MAG: 50S ribosomal protein L6 [Candidatus Peregrinibacteria bacterium CG2_30_44_17]PIP66065.1 MAG: 50S ribosomal protein L6 [Candidatus Peregrinibacteria bacterium CG22_combo_CG10-13_8_21_14_all_44_10]PIS03619.1 MAG: 50S ribosomal protein L6 [Candidatus Peregrinibacteria bacterium CG10_big_fil_rev_8_21_14_0_10_44_7]PIX78881.1 MAG: 50S ribosomal protein L6 [Candidatus Peregrinibacteria bacterium CG_4_10_14_3_um_filter_44_21]PJB88868.1 MAG: 50S ribosomal protein L6 [Candidatus Peregrinibacteri
MSRIGRQPVQIPSGVTVTEGANREITVKGSKGELKMTPHELVTVDIKDDSIVVSRDNDDSFARSLHGLTRALLNNMIIGVSTGFEKRLEIVGVGYRAQLQGNKLVLTLGYSHPVEYTPPEGVTVEMDAEKKNIIIVRGINKELVGHAASIIRGYRKPEPYKGKGIRYEGEHVRRKAGKAAGA